MWMSISKIVPSIDLVLTRCWFSLFYYWLDAVGLNFGFDYLCKSGVLYIEGIVDKIASCPLVDVGSRMFVAQYVASKVDC